MSSRKDEPVPRVAEGQTVDFRAALQATLVQQRYTDQAVLMLRGAVEAEGRLRSAETRAADLETRANELERELPVLVKRVDDARTAAAQAETLARDAYAVEVATLRSAIDSEAVKLAELRQGREAEARELEETYRTRQQQLATETATAERRLAKIKEELAAVVAKHAK
jgi:hypothetical protein